MRSNGGRKRAGDRSIGSSSLQLRKRPEMTTSAQRKEEAGVEPDSFDPDEALIRSLEALDVAMLRRRWRSLIGCAAPPHLPRSLLIRVIAYRQQVRTWGDLDRATLRALAAATETGVAAKSGASEAETENRTELRPGTLLIREHGGVMHRVSVRASGFKWNGQTYDSLSKVAFAITGTRWNGPRFFGLRIKKEIGQGQGESRSAKGRQSAGARGA
ncbi:MAG: DUF2924 domain-containing protein [Beijerinckiaceae bacterium]|nr:MAG: DUF2924 domain-containing protein [Beijerinckiaceae bacterium]